MVGWCRLETIDYFTGLDLGQTTDPSALAVVERAHPARSAERQEFAYAVRALHRWQLGTSYPDVVSAVVKAVAAPTLSGCVLVVDMTGVGRPVVDMLRKEQPACRKLVPVTITSGTAVSWADDGLHVAKVLLISTLQVVLQSARIKFAAGIPDTAVLCRELADYRVKVTQAANETFNAREGQHDDLLLALAVAVYVAEMDRPFVAPKGVIKSARPTLEQRRHAGSAAGQRGLFGRR